MIVAMAENNVIGIDNDLPWYIPEDLKRFKEVTMGCPVMMGRKTFESIFARLKKPLPGRDNIVISRSQSFDFERTHSVTSTRDAIALGRDLCKKQNIDRFFCIGGAQIYTQMISECDIIYLTKVCKIVNGDAYFPRFSDSDFELVENEEHKLEQEGAEKLTYAFQTYKRK